MNGNDEIEIYLNQLNVQLINILESNFCINKILMNHLHFLAQDD